MGERQNPVFQRLRQPPVLIPAILLLLVAGGSVGELAKHRDARLSAGPAGLGGSKGDVKTVPLRQESGERLKRLAQAHAMYLRGDYAKVLETLAPMGSNDVDVAYLRGWSHYRLGLIDDAAQDFRQGLELDPNDSGNRLGSGYCYLRRGQVTSAQREFSAILEHVPDEPGALTGLGLSHMQLGNPTAAAQLFRKVLEKDPENNEVRGYLRQAE